MKPRLKIKIIKPAFLVDSMTNRTNCPFVTSAHVRYVDFVGDFKATGQPSLTSFVRDPLMKARSRFYFRRSVELIFHKDKSRILKNE